MATLPVPACQHGRFRFDVTQDPYDLDRWMAATIGAQLAMTQLKYETWKLFATTANGVILC
jgi:hypothetical protein